MDNKKKYRLLCEQEKSIPVFNQAWWLDVVCGEENWNVCLVEKGGQIFASMPYYVQRKYGFSLLVSPPLTQFLGPWLRSTNGKYSKMLAQQKDLMQALISQLPSYDFFRQRWHFSNTNWLPFYWQGFSQTTHYTYRINDLSDIDIIWKDLKDNIRREIRKAEGRFSLKVRDNVTIEDFLKLNRLTYERQGMKLPYSEELVHNIVQAASQRDCYKFFIAQDEEGKQHAGVFIIWDENSAYYLMGGADPDLRNSGATSLCMWEAIKFSATVSKSFDFEGSMLEDVERFVRAFGAHQTPMYSIEKAPSRIMQSLLCIKKLLKR